MLPPLPKNCNCPRIYETAACPPPCPPARGPSHDQDSKYFREIGAEMMSNRLVIRMERDKNKSRKNRGQWEPPCDCDTVEIQRPSGREGPKILKRGDNNRILFRIHSKSYVGPKDDPTYRPQAISYKVGECRGGQETNDQCRTITLHPQLGAPGNQEIHTDHVTQGDEKVFLLRVKKKADSADQRKRNIEVELRTPRPPTPPAIVASEVSPKPYDYSRFHDEVEQKLDALCRKRGSKRKTQKKKLH